MIARTAFLRSIAKQAVTPIARSVRKASLAIAPATIIARWVLTRFIKTQRAATTSRMEQGHFISILLVTTTRQKGTLHSLTTKAARIILLWAVTLERTSRRGATTLILATLG